MFHSLFSTLYRWLLDDLRFYSFSKLVLSVVRLRRESNAGPLTHKASPNRPTEGFGDPCHMKREFKLCVYCNTVANHSFRFSHVEILLNVQNGKSNAQVDPSLHCLHMTERPFSRHIIYIRMQVSKGATSRYAP